MLMGLLGDLLDNKILFDLSFYFISFILVIYLKKKKKKKHTTHFVKLQCENYNAFGLCDAVPMEVL